MRLFFAGTIVKDKSGLMFKKIGNDEFDWWACLNSTYVFRHYNEFLEEWDEQVRPESEKPLLDDRGKLNRYGFRWTDLQVLSHYKIIA